MNNQSLFARFTHEEYAQVSKRLIDQIPTVIQTTMMVDKLAYQKSLGILGVLADTAEHLTVDIDLLPEPDKCSGEFRLPYEVLLIGIETENADDVNMMLTEFGWAVRAILVLGPSKTKAFLGEDVGWVFLPLASDGHGDWMPLGFLVGYSGGLVEVNEEVAVHSLAGICDVKELPFHRPLTSQIMEWLVGISSMLACSNIELEPVPVSGLRKMRAKKKGLKLDAFHRIKLPTPPRRHYVDSQGGSHASPRFHHRRGHPRTYHRGERYQKKIWIDPVYVGNPKNGKIDKDYQIRK